jgi:hypothetical protein
VARAVGLDIKGEANLLRVLNGIKDTHQKRLVRGALLSGGSEISKSIKRHAPVDTRTLKLSIGVKPAKAFRKNPNVLYVAVGARRGFERPVVRRGRAEIARPTKYAHLAEKATKFQARGVAAAIPMARAKLINTMRRRIATEFTKGRI